MNRSFAALGLATASLTVVAFAGSGCSSDETPSTGSTEPAPTPAPEPSPSPTPTPTPSGNDAQVRVVHASPDAPAVDVWIEGQPTPVVRGAKYGDASPYLTVPPGTYNFQIRPADAPVTDAPVYATGPLEVPARAKITAIAAGLLGGTTDADRFRVLALPEAWKSAANTATVRIVHVSPDAPTVGLDVGDDDPSKPEVASLARFADTGADGIQLPAGEALQVGVIAGQSRVTAFTTPRLPAGGEIFVLATGLVGKLPRENTGFALLPVAGAGALGFVRQNPTVYALHASPDAPAVDLFVGEKQIAGDVAFGMLTAPIQVPPGEYTIDFFPASPGTARPSGVPAASKPTPELQPGQRYLAAATGFLARQGTPHTFTLAALREGFDLTQPSQAMLRAWHLSPDAPAVDVGPITGNQVTPVFDNLAYLKESDPAGVAIAPASLAVGITPAQDDADILFRFGVQTTAGSRAFVIAAGAAAPRDGEQGFRLLAVETNATPWTIASLPPTE